MICLPCREAGDWNSSGHVETAAEMHTKCYGSTSCDCQHLTGNMVQLKYKIGDGSIPNESSDDTSSSDSSQLE